MADCVHHWKQEAGDLRAPFTCKKCGEVRAMETDFYRLYEQHTGRQWDRPDETSRPARSPMVVA